MSHPISHKMMLRLRQNSDNLPVSGSVMVSDPTPTASSLAENTAAVPDPSPAQTGVPLLVSSPSGSSAATASSTSTTPNSSQIPLGTVIGSCIAALVLLLLAVLLAFYYTKRLKKSAALSNLRNANYTSRRRSHLQPWKRINDDADRGKGQEQPMTQRPVSGALGAMFRTPSDTSGDKSDFHNRESVGTMRHFAKYHSGLAAEMASQSTTKDADGSVAKPQPVLRLLTRDMNAPISWDGETVGGESFMSLHSSYASSASPIAVTSAKSTPIATTSSFHHWESAEVVHVGQSGSQYSENAEPGNPFADGRAGSIKSRRSSTRGRNPFFSGRDHSVRCTLLSGKSKDPFADPEAPHDSATAIQSLIAALEEPIGGSSSRAISMQSSAYSGDDTESAISVTAFPYPPTQINVG